MAAKPRPACFMDWRTSASRCWVRADSGYGWESGVPGPGPTMVADSAICRTSARCKARRGVPWAICSRQLKPSAMISQSAGARRTAGKSSSSPMAMDNSYLSRSKPKEPAMPQQPGAGLWKSMPRRCRTDSSAVIFIKDLWWQWPWSSALRSRWGKGKSWARVSRNSLSRKIWRDKAWARSSWGNRFRSSSRNTATQLGSRPTMGIPASISGESSSRIWSRSDWARSSMPWS